jgi:hypothetical protein
MHLHLWAKGGNMYGMSDLKGTLLITSDTVECPVAGCSGTVARQRNTFRREERFKCPVHDLYISPSTFEYQSMWDNILWKDEEDKLLINSIFGVKRESRMARDNSEDALSWNVFRYMERERLISPLFQLITNSNMASPEVIYWSFSQSEGNAWAQLNRARTEFGEAINRSSEPDIIIKTDKALFFIEAKLQASNETVPSRKDNPKKYKTGGGNWHSHVFKADYETIAIESQKYELLRFWLLGSWLAKQLDLDFYLINLVVESRETVIEERFGKHLTPDAGRWFMRLTWEAIRTFIGENASPGPSKDLIINYLNNKTVGYDRNGNLQRAFHH